MTMDAKPSLIPLVDTHAHVFRRDLPFIPNAAAHFDRDFTVENLIDDMDAAGVKFAAIAAASFLGTYSDHTLEALQRYDRLRATVIVDPQASFARLRELDACGVVGVRLAVANMNGLPDLHSAAYRELLDKIVDLDWHVHVFAKPEQLPPILAALDDARIKVVIDHFGTRGSDCGPGSSNFDAVLRSLGNGRTWVKLSAPYWSEALDHRELADIFLRECGPTRLLWASDWPFVKLNGQLPYRQAVDWLADWLPDESVRRQVDANALELYRFPRDAVAT